MTKKEIIWREILHQSLEKKVFKFTQKAMAEKFHFSVSTVFNALRVPRQAGAIKVYGRFFEVVDSEKLLTIWATFRNLSKEIAYQTHVAMPVLKIIGQLSSDVILTGYAGYHRRFKDSPADFDKVHVYTKNLEEIKKRFPQSKGPVNLTVFTSDNYLPLYQELPLAQLYVDLWNLNDWQAKDFLKALAEKIF
ncbi:MAG TPA: hypothetical protein VJK25_01440 [Patescibacteria group bacterium]|nr:hypothetical protein [Patescibacteria group bacterium]